MAEDKQQKRKDEEPKRTKKQEQVTAENNKKNEATAHAQEHVGYGKPPLHNRFRKGQSGNPSGKRKQDNAECLKGLIFDELNRLLTVREGETTTKMPALQAVIRSQVVTATKGNVSAARALLKAMKDLSADEQARRTADAANKRLSTNADELSDEELADIVRAQPDDEAVS
jgi:Family of unknown function (DUF5681)